MYVVYYIHLKITPNQTRNDNDSESIELSEQYLCMKREKINAPNNHEKKNPHVEQEIRCLVRQNVAFILGHHVIFGEKRDDDYSNKSYCDY